MTVLKTVVRERGPVGFCRGHPFGRIPHPPPHLKSYNLSCKTFFYTSPLYFQFMIAYFSVSSKQLSVSSKQLSVSSKQLSVSFMGMGRSNYQFNSSCVFLIVNLQLSIVNSWSIMGRSNNQFTSFCVFPIVNLQ